MAITAKGRVEIEVRVFFFYFEKYVHMENIGFQKRDKLVENANFKKKMENLSLLMIKIVLKVGKVMITNLSIMFAKKNLSVVSETFLFDFNV